MKKCYVYLVVSVVNLFGMGIMMVFGVYVLGLIVGVVIFFFGVG